MPIVDSNLCLEKWNESELAKGGYYVYAWCCADWGDIYYYVGKGHGNRYRVVSGRGKSFTAIYNNWQVYPVILQGGLSEEEAYELEDSYKTQFIFERGFPIMDGEGNHSVLKNKAILKAKEELRAKGEMREGRPRKEPEDFQIFLKKQKDGELTVSECCEQLGISRATWYNRLREVC
jgi:hypothetical protein